MNKILLKNGIVVNSRETKISDILINKIKILKYLKISKLIMIW